MRQWSNWCEAVLSPGLAASAAFMVALSGCMISTPRIPTVAFEDVIFEVEIARSPAEQIKGLSGREGIPPTTGMLFVLQPPKVEIIWMRGMRFPLDLVWIGADCTVLETTLNAPPPAPGTPDSALPLYISSMPVAYTLEINAGDVERFGIQIEDRVRFSGISVNGAGC